MTSLATHALDPDQLDLLACITDTSTPLGSLHRDDFEAACRAVADSDGTVNPNHVSACLHSRFGEVNPRWLSAMWSSACSKAGFMDRTDEWVQIDGTHSRGNGGKSVRLRRLRGAA